MHQNCAQLFFEGTTVLFAVPILNFEQEHG